MWWSLWCRVSLARRLVADGFGSLLHVVAIFRSLAGQGEMTLSDGRHVRPTLERDGDIVVHPNFRLILLANRPGYRSYLNHSVYLKQLLMGHA